MNEGGQSSGYGNVEGSTQLGIDGGENTDGSLMTYGALFSMCLRTRAFTSILPGSPV